MTTGHDDSSCIMSTQPQSLRSVNAQGKRRNSTQLFIFSCDLSHKGQELLTLCTEWAARCDSVAGNLQEHPQGASPKRSAEDDHRRQPVIRCEVSGGGRAWRPSRSRTSALIPCDSCTRSWPT